MAAWLGIDSSNINSLCGQGATATLAKGLDGTDAWYHIANEMHWFILDLGQTYTVEKVRGRSNLGGDPIHVDIYVSDDYDDFGSAVAEAINTFQDTDTWQEVNVTTKDGRYVAVIINDTEHASKNLNFGAISPPFKIFDVYGTVVIRKGRSPCGIRQIIGDERLRGIRRNAPY